MERVIVGNMTYAVFGFHNNFDAHPSVTHVSTETAIVRPFWKGHNSLCLNKPKPPVTLKCLKTGQWHPGNVIKISREIAKLKARAFSIMANLQRRLAAYTAEFKRGRVCKDWTTANSLYHAWERICKKAEVRYKKNAFRDCFITYRVAMPNDPKLVAMEAGNSERMIREHYLQLASKAQAEGWFSL